MTESSSSDRVFFQLGVRDFQPFLSVLDLSYGPRNCCGWKLQNPWRPWKAQADCPLIFH